jgi:hypothetical protein
MNRGWGHAEMSGSGAKAARDKSEARAAPGKGARKSTSAPSVAIESMRLLGKWTLLAQRHVSADMGCSCCSGIGGNMRVQDFEQQILDYLHDKYDAAGNQHVVSLLARHAAFRREEAGSIADMLRSLATRGVDETGDPAQAADTLVMLGDLGNSIDSFERMGF